MKPSRLFWWAREIGFAFSFGVFRRTADFWWWNGSFYFDTSTVKRGPRSNFWDHSALFQSTGFGIIDPNWPFFKGKMLYMLYPGNPAEETVVSLGRVTSGPLPPHGTPTAATVASLGQVTSWSLNPPGTLAAETVASRGRVTSGHSLFLALLLRQQWRH